MRGAGSGRVAGFLNISYDQDSVQYLGFMGG